MWRKVRIERKTGCFGEVSRPWNNTGGVTRLGRVSGARNAPHTLEQVVADGWSRPYPRERAGFPSPETRAHKVWPTVCRIDGAFGDRNLVCTCPPIEANAGG